MFLEFYIMNFMALKLPLWLISKALRKKEKKEREIHTCNSVDSRFDKAF